MSQICTPNRHRRKKLFFTMSYFNLFYCSCLTGLTKKIKSLPKSTPQNLLKYPLRYTYPWLGITAVKHSRTQNDNEIGQPRHLWIRAQHTDWVSRRWEFVLASRGVKEVSPLKCTVPPVGSAVSALGKNVPSKFPSPRVLQKDPNLPFPPSRYIKSVACANSCC